MNIIEAKEILFAADACGHTPLLVGAHGIGKSEAIEQYAKENNLHCEILMLSLLDESDLLGLPTKVMQGDTPVTSWAVPTWFNRILVAAKEGKRSILLLDEFNRAPSSVLGATLQLVLSKRLNEHVLPSETFITLAINPEDGDYNVQSLDPAMLDRLVVCDVNADAYAWLKWAKANNINQKVIDFISKNPNKIHVSPRDGSKGTSPRSWTRLAKYISFVEDSKSDINTYYLKGSIGEALAAEFLLFYNNYTKHLSVEDIVAQYKKGSHKSDDINKQATAMSKFIKDLEAIQKSELAVTLQDSVKSSFDKMTVALDKTVSYLKYSVGFDREDFMPYLVYLYALPMESLAAYLKSMKSDSNDMFMKLAAFDGEINNKELFKRLIGN